MHGHDTVPPWVSEVANTVGLVSLALLAFLVVFITGLFPIPVGYERGKVKWIMWCGTGMHAHIVYWTGGHGFQTLHPADRSGGGSA